MDNKIAFLPSILNVTFRSAFYGSKYIKDFKPNLEVDCGQKFEFLPSISNVTFRSAFYGSKYIKDFKPNFEVDCGHKFEFLPSISNVTFRSAFLSKCHAFDRRCALKPNSVPLLFKPKLSIFWIISFTFEAKIIAFFEFLLVLPLELTAYQIILV